MKKISGKGYFNTNVIVKKRRKKDFSFFLFAVVFGVAVYLLATVVFKSVFGDYIPLGAFSVAF